MYGSNHFPILFEFVDSEPRWRPPRWRLDRSDLQRFTDLTSSVRPLADFSTCNDAAAYFTDVLHSVALQFVPKTSGRFPKRPISWWNADCTAAARENGLLFRDFAATVETLCAWRLYGEPLLSRDAF